MERQWSCSTRSLLFKVAGEGLNECGKEGRREGELGVRALRLLKAYGCYI